MRAPAAFRCRGSRGIVALATLGLAWAGPGLGAGSGAVGLRGAYALPWRGLVASGGTAAEAPSGPGGAGGSRGATVAEPEYRRGGAAGGSGVNQTGAAGGADAGGGRGGATADRANALGSSGNGGRGAEVGDDVGGPAGHGVPILDDDAAVVDASGAEPPPPPVLVPLVVRVLERGTRRALGGATISVGAEPVGETEADGRLTLNLLRGYHRIEAQYPGHALAHEGVDLEQGRTEELVLRLDVSSAGEQYETEVRSRRKEVPNLSIGAKEAQHVAGTSGDPVRALASLPGVSQVVWPAAVFVVRGANPGNTGFFIDGIRVPATFHLALGPSIIAPDLLGSMDFYPGAYPANFGRYIAGVVSIHTQRPAEDRVHALADVTFYDARAVVTTPVDDGRGVVAVAARYSYTRPLLSLFNEQTTVDYRDYQLRFDHSLWGGQFTIFAFGSIDQLDWTVERSQPSALTESTQTAALQFHRLDLRWSGMALGGRLMFGVTGGFDHARSSLAQAPLTVDALNAAPRLMWTRRLGAWFDTELGADAEYQHFAAEPIPFQTGKASDIGRSRPALSQGTYAVLRFHPTDHLVITPGVRADLFAEEGTVRFVPAPRLDARLDLGSYVGLKVNLGRFSQMPSLPVNVAAFESFGLKSIGLQRSDAISGGVDVRTPDDTSFEVIGFYQRMQVTDVTDVDLQSGKITGDSYLELHGGVGYGAEVLIRRSARHHFSGWVSYTLSWSLRNGPNGVVRSDWDQRHLLNLVGSYRTNGGLVMSARFHFNTGRELAVPPNIVRVEAPAYYQLDLRIEKPFVFDRFILSLFADVANATYNRELIEYVATTAGPLPSYLRLILPTLGIHGAF